MRARGFVLLEIITAVVIMSGLLMIATQARQIHQQQQERQKWIDDTEMIRDAATIYWAKHLTPPTAVDDLLAPEDIAYLNYPWQQSWSFIEYENWLELTLQAPTRAKADWLSGQVPGSMSRGTEFILIIWPPTIASAGEQYLHRLPMMDQEHLNSMATDLDMAEFDITAVSALDAQTIEAKTLIAQELEVIALKASELTVQTVYALDVITPATSMTELRTRVDEYAQLWRNCQLQGLCK
ncbi:type II secretion system protein [Pseudidiomarina sp.]|uniref:type II secretion system protein n=1 Tax=Pseudidiomarina sp. TaxID=2081707 RepID=UPI003A974E86